MSMPADRERDRRSLKDLAKLANMTPPPPSVSAPSGVMRTLEAREDDSGVVDLAAAASSDAGAVARSKSTPLASQGLFDDEPASIAAPPVSQLSQPVPSIPPTSASTAPLPMSVRGAAGQAQSTISSQNLQGETSPPAPSAMFAALSASAPSPDSRKKGAFIALVFGGLVAVSAAAAGIVYVVQHRSVKTAAVASTETPPTAVMNPAAPVNATPAAPVAQKEVAPAQAAPDPNSIPGAPGTAAPSVKAGAYAPQPAVAAVAAKPGPLKLAEKDMPLAGPPGDLGAAMQNAAGPNGSGEATPAAGSNGQQFAAGTVPQKPSQGAVTGALGAVLPAARACLGPDDPVSYASIAFGSAGSVQSVSISGGAVGKPAEGCIKGALMRAKLAPFAEPTYAARITVRH